MDAMRNYYEFMYLAIEYNINRAGFDTRNERGAVSTEMAVVMAAMVAVAVALGAIFIAKARTNANNIPDTVPAPG